MENQVKEMSIEEKVEATKRYAGIGVQLLEVGLFPGHTSEAVVEIKNWLKSIVNAEVKDLK